MEKRISCWIVLCAAILLLFSTVSCDSSSSDDIPDEVLNVAGGVFTLIGEVLEDPDNLEPGLSVTHTGSSLLIGIDNYSPNEGIWVSGEINLIEVSNNPFKISLTGSATMTGEITATISIQAVLAWPAGSAGPVVTL